MFAFLLFSSYVCVVHGDDIVVVVVVVVVVIVAVVVLPCPLAGYNAYQYDKRTLV